MKLKNDYLLIRELCQLFIFSVEGQGSKHPPDFIPGALVKKGSVPKTQVLWLLNRYIDNLFSRNNDLIIITK